MDKQSAIKKLRQWGDFIYDEITTQELIVDRALKFNFEVEEELEKVRKLRTQYLNNLNLIRRVQENL